ncbi:MAG: hypothetical protein KGO02_17500 [Alphaproteobacteria bacterium]|nr:hypothetical protein [Alphaproteobacteria bacterium]
MTRRDHDYTDTDGQMESALARWEQEGGAPSSPWALGLGRSDLADNEHDILECLGVAVVCEWNTLPTDIRRALFRHATCGNGFDPARLKAQIARFLHDRKDAAAVP